MKKIIITILVVALVLFGTSFALQGTAAKKAQEAPKRIRAATRMEITIFFILQLPPFRCRSGAWQYDGQ